MLFLAWSLVLLLPGGLLSLALLRHKRLAPLLALGALSAASLPYSPSWAGVWLYKAPFDLILLFFLAAQTLLLAGYFQHLIRDMAPWPGIDPSIEDSIPPCDGWIPHIT